LVQVEEARRVRGLLVTGMTPCRMAHVEEIVSGRDLAGVNQPEPLFTETFLAVFSECQAEQVRVEVIGDLVKENRIMVRVLDAFPVAALVVERRIRGVESLYQRLDDRVGQGLAAPHLGEEVELCRGLCEALLQHQEVEDPLEERMRMVEPSRAHVPRVVPPGEVADEGMGPPVQRGMRGKTEDERGELGGVTRGQSERLPC